MSTAAGSALQEPTSDSSASEASNRSSSKPSEQATKKRGRGNPPGNVAKKADQSQPDPLGRFIAELRQDVSALKAKSAELKREHTLEVEQFKNSEKLRQRLMFWLGSLLVVWVAVRFTHELYA